MNVPQYLERIGLKAAADHTPDIHHLCTLQHAHLYHVPFEDLDIHWNRPMPLDTESLFRKVVTDRRGGYCYELNGLFAWLLTQQGFPVKKIAARVCKGRHTGPEFDHMALIVTIEEQPWLVDVGFGDFALRPLRINEQVQFDGRNHYRFSTTVFEQKEYYTAEKWNPNKKEFQPEYLFTLQAYETADYEPMHLFQQTDPSSHFVQNLICSLPLPGGRISMINNRVIITEGSSRRELQIGNEAERRAQLQELFGIHMQLPVQV